MADTQVLVEAQRKAGATANNGWLASGGVIGAALASSCCVVPLVLALLGVSGAWIGKLTALAPLSPYFSAVALLFIGLGLWRAYVRPASVCADGTLCAQPESAVITKSALWFATVLVLLAMTVRWWAPLFY